MVTEWQIAPILRANAAGESLIIDIIRKRDSRLGKFRKLLEKKLGFGWIKWQEVLEDIHSASMINFSRRQLSLEKAV